MLTFRLNGWKLNRPGTPFDDHIATPLLPDDDDQSRRAVSKVRRKRKKKRPDVAEAAEEETVQDDHSYVSDVDDSYLSPGRGRDDYGQGGRRRARPDFIGSDFRPISREEVERRKREYRRRGGLGGGHSFAPQPPRRDYFDLPPHAEELVEDDNERRQRRRKKRPVRVGDDAAKPGQGDDLEFDGVQTEKHQGRAEEEGDEYYDDDDETARHVS